MQGYGWRGRDVGQTSDYEFTRNRVQSIGLISPMIRNAIWIELEWALEIASERNTRGTCEANSWEHIHAFVHIVREQIYGIKYVSNASLANIR